MASGRDFGIDAVSAYLETNGVPPRGRGASDPVQRGCRRTRRGDRARRRGQDDRPARRRRVPDRLHPGVPAPGPAQASRADRRGLRASGLAAENEIAAEFTSFEVGALPPFGPLLSAAEIVDRRLLEHKRVLCSGGDHRHGVMLDPNDIVRLAQPEIGDVCQD